MSSVFRACRLALVATSAAFLASCNIERTVALTVGEELTVGEQVAIEAAYAKAARILKDTPSDEDSVLAELGAAAARLVRLQGRASDVTVTNGASSRAMKAIVMRSDDVALGGQIELVLAWAGLDPVALTVDHVLLIYRSQNAPSTARFVQVDAHIGTFVDGSGTLSVTGGSFKRECAGFGGGGGGSCEVGSLTVEARLDDAAHPTLIGSIASGEMVAFRLTLR